ncbi:MAG: sprT domain-containing protein [Bacteroidetes bacterium]|nr:sprT domain-containing protein [Bacteroidota bacterium]
MQLSLRLDYFSGPVSRAGAFDSRINIGELQSHVPDNSIDYIVEWFRKNDVHLRISKARSSKFGDYRGPVKKRPAWISVNRNLNQYDFLLTLVHEMAHHDVCKGSSSFIAGYRFSKRKRGTGPHGADWKNRYRLLMEPLLNKAVFPVDLLPVVVNYFENPRSSSKMNHLLVTALKKYDLPDGSVSIDQIPFEAVFTLPGGRRFRKKEKLRKRYRCINLENRKAYLFSPMARVFPDAS